jgi:hypothetical protein
MEYSSSGRIGSVTKIFMLAARHSTIGGCMVASLLTAAAVAGEVGTAQNLTVEQIVEENVAARGGLEAWRKVQTMVWDGYVETGNPAAPITRFVYEWKRPNKMRSEITVAHEKSLYVFNGAAGWKVSPSDTGAPALRRYTRSELRSARDAQGIDGLLIDHQARGIEVALDGLDQIEGHSTYRLNVTLPSGARRRVWVDAQTFLEFKSEREPNPARGHIAPAPVYYRSYQRVDGLVVPRTIETEPRGATAAHTMVIEDVTLNPSLSGAHFERPDLPRKDRTPLIWARGDGL